MRLIQRAWIGRTLCVKHFAHAWLRVFSASQTESTRAQACRANHAAEKPTAIPTTKPVQIPYLLAHPPAIKPKYEDAQMISKRPRISSRILRVNLMRVICPSLKGGICFLRRRKKATPRLERSRITLIQTDIVG